VTSMMKGVEAIQRTLDALLIRKKAQSTEGERLRTAYLSPAWEATNLAFESFLFKKFESALDGTWDTGAWPREDRFVVGMDKIQSKVLPDLLRWARDQTKLRGAAQAGGGCGGGVDDAGGGGGHGGGGGVDGAGGGRGDGVDDAGGGGAGGVDDAGGGGAGGVDDDEDDEEGGEEEQGVVCDVCGGTRYHGDECAACEGGAAEGGSGSGGGGEN
jgi:hypothetical protein